MSLITKINLGIPPLKESIDLSNIDYRSPLDFGWEPGWETFDISNKSDYLNEDLINLFNSLGIIISAFFFKLSPGYQEHIVRSKPEFGYSLVGFKLSGSLQVQAFDLSGYSPVDPTQTPYRHKQFNAEYYLRPEQENTGDPNVYLKSGQIGLNGNPVTPVELLDFNEITTGSWIMDPSIPHSGKNISNFDDTHVLIITTNNVSKEYFNSALLPYVVE